MLVKTPKCLENVDKFSGFRKLNERYGLKSQLFCKIYIVYVYFSFVDFFLVTNLEYSPFAPAAVIHTIPTFLK